MKQGKGDASQGDSPHVRSMGGGRDEEFDRKKLLDRTVKAGGIKGVDSPQRLLQNTLNTMKRAP